MPAKFKNYLVSEVKRISKRERLSEDKAFLFWFATSILELSDDDAREAVSVEGSNDKGVDLFWVDDEEGRVIIAQGKYSSALSTRPTIGQVTKLESSINWLSNPEALRRDGRPDLAQAAEDYLAAIKDGYGVELWFVYTGPKCINVEKHINVYNQNPEHSMNRRALRHYHIEMLEATWEEIEGTSRRIESEIITIAEGTALPFAGQFGKALIANISASELVRLYKKYEDHLFDRNVRLFLGSRKGSVNAGLAETLSNEKECLNFWAYNNGITFICDEAVHNANGIELKNFSIVNGCQTTVSLAQAPKDNLSGVTVLSRFVAASAEIVDEVIRYNNSQNPIRTWDIASQDKTQRRLKSQFASLQKPYIYLTRRGARPKGDLRKFREGSKLRQIRIDVIGQYAAAFKGNPVLAYKHKAFIFSRHHDDVFPQDVPVEVVLFQWICGEICRDRIQAAISRNKEEEVRIMKKGGTLFVLAVMSNILTRRNGATYLHNARENNVSSKATAKRLRNYAEYSSSAYVQAVLDQMGVDNQELTTLIRQPEFYKKVIGRVERKYETDSRITKYLSEALSKLDLAGTPQ